MRDINNISVNQTPAQITKLAIMVNSYGGVIEMESSPGDLDNSPQSNVLRGTTTSALRSVVDLERERASNNGENKGHETHLRCTLCRLYNFPSST